MLRRLLAGKRRGRWLPGLVFTIIGLSVVTSALQGSGAGGSLPFILFFLFWIGLVVVGNLTRMRKRTDAQRAGTDDHREAPRASESRVAESEAVQAVPAALRNTRTRRGSESRWFEDTAGGRPYCKACNIRHGAETRYCRRCGAPLR